MAQLYGNGIADDTLAIQELLDTGASLVRLPEPEVCYCISSTLRLHSNQTLELGRNTTVRLLPGSNCCMVGNAEKGAHDIAVIGGIWDYNNLQQAGNRLKTDPDWWDTVSHADGDWEKVVTYETLDYTGVIMRFSHVTRLVVKDVTLKDPAAYCLQMAYTTYFTVENVFFDQNMGNPSAENMDGIHIDGGCRFGTIRNVKGTCYDDMVALNCDDCYDGPISDISIDGVFGEHSLRGVRLLSLKSPLERVSIQNVYGTFYQNAIGITYFYPRRGSRGKMSHISIRNVFAAHAPRKPEYNKPGPYRFSHVWVDRTLDIDSITIDNLHCTETLGETPLIKVGKDTNIRNLSVSNVTWDNQVGVPLPMMLNQGNIRSLYLYNTDPGNDELLVNEGEIENLTKQ